MPEKHNGRPAGIAPVATVYIRSNTLTTVEEDIYHRQRSLPQKGGDSGLGGGLLGKIERQIWITRY
jgi:hypothetical protein